MRVHVGEVTSEAQLLAIETSWKEKVQAAEAATATVQGALEAAEGRATAAEEREAVLAKRAEQFAAQVRHDSFEKRSMPWLARVVDLSIRSI